MRLRCLWARNSATPKLYPYPLWVSSAVPGGDCQQRLPPALSKGSMEYTANVLDRQSGDLNRVSLGNWVTVTEYGQTKGVGPVRVRAVLSRMGLLIPETEPAKRGSRTVTRRRLSQEAVKAGL